MNPREMKMREALDELEKSFTAATQDLVHFYRDTQEGIATTKEQQGEILHKFYYAAGGDVDQPPVEDGDGVIAINFTKSEAETIIFALERVADSMTRYPRILTELTFVALVARFEAFFADLLRFIFSNRPEMMKSRNSITYEEVLSYESMTLLTLDLADQEVQRLSFKSFKDQATELEKRFGLRVGTTTEDIETLAEAFSRRNLLLHSDGFVNDLYLNRHPEPEMTEDGRIVTDDKSWQSILSVSLRCAKYLRKQAEEKLMLSPTEVRQ